MSLSLCSLCCSLFSCCVYATHATHATLTTHATHAPPRASLGALARPSLGIREGGEYKEGTSYTGGPDPQIQGPQDPGPRVQDPARGLRRGDGDPLWDPYTRARATYDLEPLRLKVAADRVLRTSPRGSQDLDPRVPGVPTPPRGGPRGPTPGV